CGSGTWGDIAVDASTQHVDQGYTGGASDGTAAHPWTSIKEAIQAAPKDGLVAIAAGTYAEDVEIYDRPVRLVGRCPAMVEVAGAGVNFASLTVYDGADGSVV